MTTQVKHKHHEATSNKFIKSVIVTITEPVGKVLELTRELRSCNTRAFSTNDRESTGICYIIEPNPFDAGGTHSEGMKPIYEYLIHVLDCDVIFVKFIIKDRKITDETVARWIEGQADDTD